MTANFLEKYPNVSDIDTLQSEKDKKDFIIAFRDIIRKHAEIQVYDDFEEDDPDLGFTEQQFADFTSKYLDIRDTFIDPTPAPPEPPTDEPKVDPKSPDEPEGLDDIDFCLELLHSDIINVAYILELIANLNPLSDDYTQRRQEILDTMIKDAEMRSKVKLIDGFIQKNVDDDADNFIMQKSGADGTSDLEERLNDYISEERCKAISQISSDENIPEVTLNKFLEEYDFSGKEQIDIIQNALKEKHLGLSMRRKALRRIIERMHLIIRTFSWN